MDAVELVTLFWHRIQERDWQGVGDLLADDVVLEWPVTREVVRGRANVVAVNAEYPEGWRIRMLRALGSGDDVVTEVEVPHAGIGVFRAASFWTVSEGRIVWGREYWSMLGAEEPPAWRAQLVERT